MTKRRIIVTERSDMSRNNKRDKKTENKELIISACIALFIIAMVIGIVIVSKHSSDKNNGSQETVNASSVEDYSKYSEDAEKYSAGLTDEGKISGIDRIDDYVKLPASLDSYILYLGDYPIEEDIDIANAGAHLIDKITEDSEVKDYEAYRKVTEDICRYSAEGWYTAYVEAHQNVPESQKYTSFEDFLKYSQNMDMETYENHIYSASVKEMKKYMVEQALVEKFGISFTDDDITETAILFDVKATNEKNAKETIARFGLPYMKQRTAEHKLEILLVDKAVKTEGSIKDGWKDESRIYSAGLYDNGRISGIGDISVYVTELYDPSKIEGIDDIDYFTDTLYDNSKVKEYEGYTTKLKELFAYITNTKASQNEGKAIAECKYRIFIQYLFDKYGLNTEIVKDEFFKGKNSDEREEYVYTYGNAYLNRQLMEFAVKKHLSKIMKED